jgi:LacI family transcriptional regulator
MASLADVARHAGVSIATASRALSGSSHPVSDEVRQRIMVAAREVGYSPSALARALVTRRSRIIGVIVGDIVDPYFAEITRGAEDVARREGYLTMVCNADRSTAAEVAYLRVLRDYQAEGVIFAGGGEIATGGGSDPIAEAVAEARAEGLGIVALAARSFASAQVAIDNRAACFDITSYVLSLGHRTVAFVQGPAGFTTARDRMAGFQAAMIDAGLDPTLVYEGGFDYEAGRAAALRMVGRALPDAVICANDEAAIGALMTFRQAGVEVPDQLSIAGIDDTRASRFVDLTTVGVPMYELGAIGARTIVDGSGRSIDVRTELPHRLVPRGTTARRAGSAPAARRTRAPTPRSAG